MIQPVYCSSGMAAWWKNCPLCAKLRFLCSSCGHSLPFPKVLEHVAFACALGASPEASLTALSWAWPLRRDTDVEWIANLNYRFYYKPLLFGILLTSGGGSSVAAELLPWGLGWLLQEKQPLLTQLFAVSSIALETVQCCRHSFDWDVGSCDMISSFKVLLPRRSIFLCVSNGFDSL